jgi:hypothetical protein
VFNMLHHKLASGPSLARGPRRAARRAQCIPHAQQRRQQAGSDSNAAPAAAQPNGGVRTLTLARLGFAKQLTAPQDAPVAGDVAGVAGDARDASWWDALPSRYKVLLGGFMSFVICNMVGARFLSRILFLGFGMARSMVWAA